MIFQKSLTRWHLNKVIRNAIVSSQPAPDTGVAVAVVRAGQLVFSGGFGLRDREQGIRVNAHTRFAIGSATKAFNSVLLSIHAAGSKGGFSLDQPVTNFAPDFGMEESRTDQMTLVDMLSHQTGLPRNDALWYLGPFTRDQLYFRLRGLEQIDGAFRTQFLYNNLMCMTAGHVLESLTGTSWEQLVQQAILDKLGMSDTNFTLTGLVAGGNYAKAYYKAAPIPLKDYTNIGPAAEINSTVLDLAKWVQMFLTKGLTSNGGTLLDSSTVERQYKGLIATGAKDVSYGLGWYVGRLAQKPYIFHDGIADGYSSLVSFMPEQDLGVIVLANEHTLAMDSQLKDYWPLKVAKQIYDWMLNGKITGTLTLPPFPDGAGEFELPMEAVPTGHLPPDAGIFGDYAGLYSDQAYGDMAIGRIGSGLQISYFGLSWPIQVLGGDAFGFKLHANGVDLTLYGKFQRDSNRKVTGFIIRLTPDANISVVFARR